MTTFLNLVAVRARHLARAGDDRLVEMVGDRGRAEVPAGQGRREFDQPEGRRSRVHARRRASRAATAPRSIVMAFDEKGQADTLERRIEICRRCYRHPDRGSRLSGRGRHLRSQHLRHRDRHRGAQQLRPIDFIEATHWIRENLPHAQVSGGVSNVSFSFRGNDAVREAITPRSCTTRSRAGHDRWAIVNAGQLGVYDGNSSRAAASASRT